MISKKIDKSKTPEAKCDFKDMSAQNVVLKDEELQDASENINVGFFIVGIGASAGGLAAFEAFFSGMPTDADPDMAFVLVQHLDPNHESILADLIQRYTRMQVLEVEDGMEVKLNCVYIIPPNRDMVLLRGKLKLRKPSAPRGQRLPINNFFYSLAQDQHERSICIVLSGTGSDGTLGVQAIKGEGGMVMVQKPDTTKYDGMPRSAISSGMVDYELPPVEMPMHLLAYATHAVGRLTNVKTSHEPKDVKELQKAFYLLSNQTGHDFSLYKPSTIERRMERRIAINQIKSISEYIKYLQQTPMEVEALFRDLLIGVTSFFRDPEVFDALCEKVIAKLLAEKTAGDVVRVWSTGCSTGEEAYSLAIILQEQMEVLKKSFTVQIFATDIDSRSIVTARAGVYPFSIASDISADRLSRFFTIEPNGKEYRILKGIRDMLIFSEQDVIKDAPFSKLDLISCRNLLIYMGSNLQKKLIPLFHYALKPGGALLLGTSETIGEFGELFDTLDSKSKLYKRKECFQGARRKKQDNFLPFIAAMDASLPLANEKTKFPVKVPLREITEQALLQQVAPSGALVNGDGDIFYIHGRTGMYLEPAQGEAGINNILKMAREGLKHELAILLHKSVITQEIMVCKDLHIKTNGHFTIANLTIRPIVSNTGARPETPLYLVILEEVIPLGPKRGLQKLLKAIEGTDYSNTDENRCIEELKQELRAKEEYIQMAKEQQDSSNEELKSSNEEMQSVNEELQSTNEELETSKEELQSVNEELSTVNNELQTIVSDLSLVNNDMNNLLAGTGIATVFIDYKLHILRFTPTATRIINLIPSDVGRPVAHIVSNFVGYNQMVEDTQAVLDTLIPKELEIQTTEGKWYIMRIQPYRTVENVIEGAVLTFVDNTDAKKAKDALGIEEIRYRRLFETAQEGIIILDAETGKIINVNPFSIEMLGSTEEQLIGKAIWGIELFKNIVADQEDFLKLQQKEYIHYEDLLIETAYGRQIDVEFISNVYLVDKQKVIQFDFRDITKRKNAEETLKRSETLLRATQQLTNIGSWEWDIKTQTMFWTDEIYNIHDLKKDDVVLGLERMAQSMEGYLPKDREVIHTAFQRCVEEGEPYDLEFRFITVKERILWIRTFAEPVWKNSKVVKVTGFIMDISSRQHQDK